jgi:hypothetical protein
MTEYEILKHNVAALESRCRDLYDFCADKIEAEDDKQYWRGHQRGVEYALAELGQILEFENAREESCFAQ